MYAKETGCQFPIYTDPTRSLFDALGMVKTLNMGDKPAYAKKSTSRGIFDSIVQGLKQVPKGLALKSGDHRQVGGEFLYEPPRVSTPVTTPQVEQHPQFGTLGGPENGNGKAREEEKPAEEKKITWCHRMKTTRDHVEMPELMEVLGLDSQAHVPAPKDEKRWAEATRERKGTGATMVPEMKRLSQAARESAEHSHEPVAVENNWVLAVGWRAFLDICLFTCFSLLGNTSCWIFLFLAACMDINIPLSLCDFLVFFHSSFWSELLHICSAYMLFLAWLLLCFLKKKSLVFDLCI